MSLVKGALTLRRYVCDGAPIPDSAAELVEILHKDAFRGRLDSPRKTESSGWVTLDNLLDTDFSVEGAYRAPYLVFALRTDRKAIPPALMRALVDKRAREMMAEAGLERLTPGSKDEIREEIEETYLPRILPTVSVVEVCWNLPGNVVWVLSGAQKGADRVRKQFSASFSRALVPADPIRRALAGEGGADRADRLRVLGGVDLTTGPGRAVSGEGRGA